jgi:hypothetical protein
MATGAVSQLSNADGTDTLVWSQTAGHQYIAFGRRHPALAQNRPRLLRMTREDAVRGVTDATTLVRTALAYHRSAASPLWHCYSGQWAVSRFFWSVTQRWSRYGAAEIRILDERDAWSDDVAIQGSDFMDVDLFACGDTPSDDALDGAILATIGAVTEAVSATVRTWSVSSMVTVLTGCHVARKTTEPPGVLTSQPETRRSL